MMEELPWRQALQLWERLQSRCSCLDPESTSGLNHPTKSAARWVRRHMLHSRGAACYTGRMAIQQLFSSTRQLDLLGGAVAASQVHRLFFALLPAAATRARLLALAELLKRGHPELRARWVDPARYHATLHFLGDHAALRPDLVEAALAAAGKLRAAAFEWTLDSAISFRGREPPCVLRGAEVPPPLLQLWQALGHALALAGQGGSREREFTPHVTLGYGRGALAQPLAVEPVTWPAREFALIHHVVGQGAYQVLGRWPLADA